MTSLDFLWSKELFSGIALVFTFYIFVPYIRSIRSGQTKPHVFSWAIWAIGTFVVFLAQVSDGGGIGAWPIGISAIISGYVTLMAFRRRADTSINRLDWIMFVFGLAALAAWGLTSNPLGAVILITLADLIGFGPMVRKLYHDPYSEPMRVYVLFCVRNLFVVLALEHYSVVTVLFPAAVSTACAVMFVLVSFRRRNFKPQSSSA